MTPGSPSDSPCTRRAAVWRASRSGARAAAARSTARRMNASSIVVPAANDQTRARICDAGEYAAHASRAPSAPTIITVSPAAGLPVTRSTAPENTHG